MRAGNLGVPLTSEWLNGVLAPGSRVGIDPVSKILVLIPCSNDYIIFHNFSNSSGFLDLGKLVEYGM